MIGHMSLCGDRSEKLRVIDRSDRQKLFGRGFTFNEHLTTRPLEREHNQGHF